MAVAVGFRNVHLTDLPWWLSCTILPSIRHLIKTVTTERALDRCDDPFLLEPRHRAVTPFELTAVTFRHGSTETAAVSVSTRACARPLNCVSEGSLDFFTELALAFLSQARLPASRTGNWRTPIGISILYHTKPYHTTLSVLLGYKKIVLDLFLRWRKGSR